MVLLQERNDFDHWNSESLESTWVKCIHDNTHVMMQIRKWMRRAGHKVPYKHYVFIHEDTETPYSHIAVVKASSLKEATKTMAHYCWEVHATVPVRVQVMEDAILNAGQPYVIQHY